jgi:hypothetical protein
MLVALHPPLSVVSSRNARREFFADGIFPNARIRVAITTRDRARVFLVLLDDAI